MFVYEKDNAININFDGNTTELTPDIVIKGYANGASLSVNGESIITVENPVEFKPFARTYMFQRDNKLMITFNGVEGMNNPEVIIDEVTAGKVELTINGEVAVINYTNDSVSVETTQEEPEEDLELVPEDTEEGSETTDGPTYDLPTVEEEEEE